MKLAPYDDSWYTEYNGIIVVTIPPILEEGSEFLTTVIPFGKLQDNITTQSYFQKEQANIVAVVMVTLSALQENLFQT